MDAPDRDLLRQLLTGTRVLSLGVLVDDKPHVGLLPYAVAPDFRSALVHASQLARHGRGLRPGAPHSLLIHGADDPAGDPLQVPRVTISGTVQHVARSDRDWAAARQRYLDRFPTAERTFLLGDFNLYRLSFEWGRLVVGFARAINLDPESFAARPGSREPAAEPH